VDVELKKVDTRGYCTLLWDRIWPTVSWRNATLYCWSNASNIGRVMWLIRKNGAVVLQCECYVIVKSLFSNCLLIAWCNFMFVRISV